MNRFPMHRRRRHRTASPPEKNHITPSPPPSPPSASHPDLIAVSASAPVPTTRSKQPLHRLRTLKSALSGSASAINAAITLSSSLPPNPSAGKSSGQSQGTRVAKSTSARPQKETTAAATVPATTAATEDVVKQNPTHRYRYRHRRRHKHEKLQPQQQQEQEEQQQQQQRQQPDANNKPPGPTKKASVLKKTDPATTTTSTIATTVIATATGETTETTVAAAATTPCQPPLDTINSTAPSRRQKRRHRWARGKDKKNITTALTAQATTTPALPSSSPPQIAAVPLQPSLQPSSSSLAFQPQAENLINKNEATVSSENPMQIQLQQMPSATFETIQPVSSTLAITTKTTSPQSAVAFAAATAIATANPTSTSPSTSTIATRPNTSTAPFIPLRSKPIRADRIPVAFRNLQIRSPMKRARSPAPPPISTGAALHNPSIDAIAVAAPPSAGATSAVADFPLLATSSSSNMMSQSNSGQNTHNSNVRAGSGSGLSIVATGTTANAGTVPSLNTPRRSSFSGSVRMEKNKKGNASAAQKSKLQSPALRTKPPAFSNSSSFWGHGNTAAKNADASSTALSSSHQQWTSSPRVLSPLSVTSMMNSSSASATAAANRRSNGIRTPSPKGVKMPLFMSSSTQDIKAKFNELTWIERNRIAFGSRRPRTDNCTSSLARPATASASLSSPSEPRNGNNPFSPSRRLSFRYPEHAQPDLDRYPDILPWKHNRIVLNVPKGTQNYINASPITLVSPNDSANLPDLRYIAMQGPTLASTPYVWRMISEQIQKQVVIVQLTNLVESRRSKCFPYFPLEEGSVMHLNDKDIWHDGWRASIRFVSRRVLADGAIESRKLVLRVEYTDNSKKPREWTVRHLFYTRWPDYGVPTAEDLPAFLQLIELSQHYSKDTHDPRIVHCSAGVGRTGTFIALEFLKRELDMGFLTGDGVSLVAGSMAPPPLPEEMSPVTPGGVDTRNDLIFSTVDWMREQRKTMVQSESQYMFLYQMLRKLWRDRYGLSAEDVAELAARGQ